MLSVLTKHGYTQSDRHGLRSKQYRPKSIGDARRMIAETFERNQWNRNDQERYFRGKGIDAKYLEELTNDDIRAVLGYFEKARMIIFAD